MAGHGGPDLVQDGLVLSLDAADKNSYPGSGTTWYDLSGNGNDGTISGCTFSTDYNGIFNFDGSNDKVSVSRTESGGDLTVSLWVNPADTPSGNDRVITQGHASNLSKRWLIAYYTSTSSYLAKVYNATTGWTFGTITPNEWNHIAFTYDSGTIKTYVNGVSGGVTEGTAFGMPDISILSIGAMDGDTSFWNGSIKNVAIWNRVLTPTEVSQNFNAQRSIFSV